mgnify:CR=1 FL=1
MFKQVFYSISVFLILIAVFFFWQNSQAQTEPLLLISWQAQNFAPLGFLGKNLPIIYTPVVVGLEMIEKNQIINLKNYEIRWYVDGKFEDSGKGLTTMRFLGGKPGGTDEHFIRAEIMDYKGANLAKTINVPLVSPQIVIFSPYQGYQVPVLKPGTNVLKALPYFFNVEKIGELTINWEAGGVKTEGGAANQDILNLTIPETAPDNFVLPVKVGAINKNQPLERASQNINFTVVR